MFSENDEMSRDSDQNCQKNAEKGRKFRNWCEVSSVPFIVSIISLPVTIRRSFCGTPFLIVACLCNFHVLAGELSSHFLFFSLSGSQAVLTLGGHSGPCFFFGHPVKVFLCTRCFCVHFFVCLRTRFLLSPSFLYATFSKCNPAKKTRERGLRDSETKMDEAKSSHLFFFSFRFPHGPQVVGACWARAPWRILFSSESQSPNN